MTTSVKPVTVISSSPRRLEQVCSVATRALIDARTSPVWNETGAELTADELEQRLAKGGRAQRAHRSAGDRQQHDRHRE